MLATLRRHVNSGGFGAPGARPPVAPVGSCTPRVAKPLDSPAGKCHSGHTGAEAAMSRYRRLWCVVLVAWVVGCAGGGAGGQGPAPPRAAGPAARAGGAPAAAAAAAPTRPPGEDTH